MKINTYCAICFKTIKQRSRLIELKTETGIFAQVCIDCWRAEQNTDKLMEKVKSMRKLRGLDIDKT